MINKMVGDYKEVVVGAAWFISIVVVPLTIWFVAISHKIDSASAKIIIVEEKEEQLQRKIHLLDTRIADKLEVIHKDIGEIKGELKRLQ